MYYTKYTLNPLQNSLKMTERHPITFLNPLARKSPFAKQAKRMRAHAQNIAGCKKVVAKSWKRLYQTDNTWKLIEKLFFEPTLIVGPMPQAPSELPSELSLHKRVLLVHECATRGLCVGLKHNVHAVKRALTKNIVVTIRNHCNSCGRCKTQSIILTLWARRHASGDYDRIMRLNSARYPRLYRFTGPNLIK